MPRLTLARLSDLSQVFCAVAVVASLIYVGVEIRRNQSRYRPPPANPSLEEGTLRYRWIISRLLTLNEPAQAMWERFGPSFGESFKAEVARIRSVGAKLARPGFTDSPVLPSPRRGCGDRAGLSTFPDTCESDHG